MAQANTTNTRSSFTIRSQFAIFIVCLGLIFLKSPDAVLHPQLWAEDGTIYYAQQFGEWRPLLFVPYAGYLNFIPRLIAWLATGVSPGNTPLFYNLSSIIINAFFITYAVIRMSPLFGFAVTMGAFFLTPTIGDIFGCITNIQWFAQFALIFGVIGSALKGRRYGIGDFISVAIILVASLSGPFSVVDAAGILILWSIASVGKNLPLPRTLVGSAAEIISDIDTMRVLPLMLGAFLQLMTMARHGIYTPETANALTVADRKLFGFGFLFDKYQQAVNSPFGHSQLLILSIYIIIFVYSIINLLKSYSYRSVIIVLLMCIGALQPILAYTKQREWHTLSSISHYYYFFGVIALCSVASTIIMGQTNNRKAIVLSGCTCLLLFLIAKPEYFIRPRLRDMNWPKFAARISAGEHTVVAPLNPGWRVVITQDR
jgi:hypothetical protein